MPETQLWQVLARRDHQIATNHTINNIMQKVMLEVTIKEVDTTITKETGDITIIEINISFSNLIN